MVLVAVLHQGGWEARAAVAGTGTELGHSQLLLLQKLRSVNYPGGKSAFPSTLGWIYLHG